MKNSAILAAATGLLAVTGTVAFAGECTNASLSGHYTYWMQGADSEGKTYAEVGQEHYDGKGNVESVFAVSGEAKVEKETGTYTINDDCSGTVVYSSGNAYTIFVAPSGDSFVVASAEGGIVQIGENTRVGTK